MDIILIGSGNTATVLGRKSLAAGHRIIQVYSRQEEHAGLLARQLNAIPVSSVSSIGKEADLMIIALRDEAIIPFVQMMGEIPLPVAHTAGAVPLHAVQNSGNLFGVIYPLQSLRKEIGTIPPLTLLVDSNGPLARDVFFSFAAGIAETTIAADDTLRLKYHLAATLVNNFTNYLFAVTENFCVQEKISFALLQPLLEETVLRLRNISPAAAQTGPAFRNDQQTLDKHRQLIKEYPALSRIYELFTQEIQKAAFALKV